MTWTYGGDPGSSDLDRLRMLIGDVQEGAPLLSDAEIEGVFFASAGIYSAAATLCRALAGKFATDVSVTLSAAGIAESASDRSRQYLALAKDYALLAKAEGELLGGSSSSGTGGAVIAPPFVSGVDAGDMNDVDLDINRPRPAFSSTQRYPLPYSTWRP